MADAPGPTDPPQKESVKETIISVIIAFTMAFVFRSFVAEAFIIPTGSMAPTLNGAHMRVTSPYTGEDWGVSPPLNIDGNSQNPYPSQSERSSVLGAGRRLVMHDPVTGLEVSDSEGRVRAGDRIFVLKFLYGIQSPEPYDVVVFKNPTMPDENYIKRLIALPGEQVALVDGDVFVRGEPKVGAAPGPFPSPWDAKDWTIRRKPPSAQRAVWQRVFDSALMTSAAVKAGAESPWVATGAETDEARSRYTTTGAPAVIAWDTTKRFILPSGAVRFDFERYREINDRYWYNEIPYNLPDRVTGQRRMPSFNVGDVRMRATVIGKGAGMVVEGSGLTLGAVVESRGHAFRGRFWGGKAVVSMMPLEGEGAGVERVLAEAPFDAAALAGGKPVGVEFWHSDQRLQLWVNGKLVVSGEYNWLPMERLEHAMTSEGWLMFTGKAPTRSRNVLAEPAAYRRTTVRWETSGAPVELRSVALDRDLYYRPADHPPYPLYPNQRELGNTPGAATSPQSTLSLGPDQFFVCGDNSPQSLDARLWGYPDAWVAEEIDPSPSVVARRLMMGKAFFVYFPAPVGGSPVSVPDFGRLRAIR